MRLAFCGLREKTGQPWELEHFGASDFNDPAALGRLRAAIKGADILIGSAANPHKTRDLGEILLIRSGAGCGKIAFSSNSSKISSTNSTPTSNSQPIAANEPRTTLRTAPHTARSPRARPLGSIYTARRRGCAA